MKRLAILLLFSGMLAFAQDKPAGPKELTAAESKVVIAQQALELSRLTATLNEAKLQLALFESATGTKARREADNAAIEAAQRELVEARNKAQPEQKK